MTYLKDSVGENQWNDIIIAGNALRSGASAPDPINHPKATTIQVYGFDGGNTLEQLDGSFEIAHDYAQGSPLYPHVHWMPTTDVTGNVIWRMDYAVANVGDAYISGNITGTCAASGIGVHEICSLESVDITGLHIGAVLCFRLFRDPTTDTYPNDAGLLSVGIHYQSDTLGSRTIQSK